MSGNCSCHVYVIEYFRRGTSYDLRFEGKPILYIVYINYVAFLIHGKGGSGKLTFDDTQLVKL